MGFFSSKRFGIQHVNEISQVFPGILSLLVQQIPVVTTTHTKLYFIEIRSNNRRKKMLDTKWVDPFRKGIVKRGQQVRSVDTRRCHPPKQSSPKLLPYV